MIPFRLTILQFSQSFFTDARTFIVKKDLQSTDSRRSVKRRHAILCQNLWLPVRDENRVLEMCR